MKVVSLDTTYEVWERLKTIFEGNDRVKLSKIQTTRGTYENLRIAEGERVVRYFQKVDNVENEIKYLGGVLDEKDVIQNIMRTLPKSYTNKISTIGETYDPTKFTREQLLGTLTTFEMRKFGRDKSKLETTFK